MKISNEGINLIKFFEGCPTDKDGNVVSYRCAANKATIGFGSLKLIDGSPVKDDMTISKQDAEDLLAHELHEYEGYINDIPDVPLQQCQFDALVCWVYNLGPTNLRSSTMLKELNAGSYDLVPFQMKRWDKAGGKPLLGLTRRRNAEALLFKNEDWNDYLEVEA